MTAQKARYTPEQRRKVRARFKVLRKEGLIYETIAAKLSSEGFTTPSGKPITKITVGNMAVAIEKKRQAKSGKRLKKKRLVSAKADTRTSKILNIGQTNTSALIFLKRATLNILNSKISTDAQKVKSLKAIVGLEESVLEALVTP